MCVIVLCSIVYKNYRTKVFCWNIFTNSHNVANMCAASIVAVGNTVLRQVLSLLPFEYGIELISFGSLLFSYGLC